MIVGRSRSKWTIAALVSAVLAVPACATSTATTTTDSPAQVESITGSDVKQVTLTQRATERLNIKTTQARFAAEAQSQRTVPYSAVLYDVQGNTWVYTMPKPLTYVRHRVVVADIRSDQATLIEGPPSGTMLVTEGAAMLYGTELGVGK
jgi:uncharacterized protein YcfL